MKHFIVGPVEMYSCTKEIYENPTVYFRTPEFSSIVNDCMLRLSKLVGNSTENSLIYLTASGTAMMEAVVENCVFEDDKVLVVNGGTFGHRFCELLSHHNKNYTSIDLNFGEELTQEHLQEHENKDYTMFFVNLHETSVGQLYDAKMIKEFCERNNLELVVDAISTFMADKFNMEEYGIDCSIFSSQKGLCLSAGLSFASFSKRMVEKIEKCEKVPSLYFNFKDYFKNILRGQTPYTPAVNIIYELKAMLDYIEEFGGVEDWLDFIANKAKYSRKKAMEFGYEIPNYPLSNMLTPLVFDDVKASDIVKTLKDKYQIFVNPCGGELADKVIRVSHIGNTNFDDIDN